MKTTTVLIVAVSTLLALPASAEEFIGKIVSVDRNFTTNATSKFQITARQFCKRGESLDFQGGDFMSVRGGENVCCQACRDHGCASYTWTNYEGGTCWLKNQVLTPKIYIGAKGCIVGNFDWQVAEFANCDMPGNDLYHGTVNGGAKECQFWCWSNAYCKAATYTDFEGGTCYYKTKVTECVYSPGASTNVPLNEGIFDGWDV